MNSYLVAAAVLALVVGLVHSVLGETLIFRRLRQRSLVPTNGGNVLLERHVRILWASWHVLTVFGGLIAFQLWQLAANPAAGRGSLAGAIVVAMILGSLLVLVGTKGRHPGWVGLLGVAALVWMSGGAIRPEPDHHCGLLRQRRIHRADRESA